MSQENVERVRGAFAAFDRGDLSHLLELLDKDVVTHRTEPDNVVYHGREGFLQAIAVWTEDFEEFTMTPEEFIEAGDDVLVRVRQAARGQGSGAPVEGDFWFLYEIREAICFRMTFWTDARTAEAFRAAGLSE
jgi:ketosteroid isomerase-like protein